MALNTAVEGRTYERTPPYVVSRAKIAEFAAAVGADNPVHTDPQSARSLGHADVVAPPTYLVGVAQQGEAAAITDPEAGIDFTRLVHGEQAFTHHRPVVAGDELTAQTTVERARLAGGHGMLTLRTEVRAGEESVCTTKSVMVIRGED